MFGWLSSFLRNEPPVVFCKALAKDDVPQEPTLTVGGERPSGGLAPIWDGKSSRLCRFTEVLSGSISSTMNRKQLKQI